MTTWLPLFLRVSIEHDPSCRAIHGDYLTILDGRGGIPDPHHRRDAVLAGEEAASLRDNRLARQYSVHRRVGSQTRDRASQRPPDATVAGC